MIKNIVRFSLISLLTILIIGSTAWAQSDWLIFRNTEFKFRFLYPPDWHISTPRGPNVRGKVIAPNNKPNANCVIVVRQVPELSKSTQREINKEISSETWSKKYWEEVMSSKFSEVFVHETKKIKVDNRPAQFATIMMSYETIQAKIYSKNVNFITMSPGWFWHFGSAAGGVTQGEADHSFQYWTPTFFRVISSFVFEN